MPTLDRIDGFEHGIATSAVVFDNATGSPTIVTTPVRTGSRALSCAASGAGCYVRYTIPAGNRKVTQSFYFRISSLPGSGTPEFAAIGHTTVKGVVRVNSSGACQALITGGLVQTHGTTLVAGTWYRLDMVVDSSTGTWTLDWSIDGTSGTQATSSQTAADITGAYAGITTASTITVYYDDWAIATGSSDYPIGPHSVESLIPSADGTHNIGSSGDFDSFTTTAFSNYTTTGYSYIGHRPLQYANTADQVIRQDINGATNYMEFTLENMSGSNPVGVRAYGVHVESASVGASNGEMRLLLSDNTEVLTTGSISMINSTEDPSTTVTLRDRMCIDPSGGWDATKVNGLKVRLGFGDGNPDVNFIDCMLEVLNIDIATVTGAASLAPDSSLASTALLEVLAGAALAPDSSLTSAALLTVLASAGLSGAGSMTSPALLIIPASSSVSASSAVGAASLLQVLAQASASAGGTLTAAALCEILGASSISGDTVIVVSGDVFVQIITGAASITGTGSVASSGLRMLLAAAALEGLGSMTVAGLCEALASSSISGTSSLTADSLQIALAQAGMEAASGMTVSGMLEVLASLSVDGAASLSAGSINFVLAQAAANGSGSLSTDAMVEVRGVASIAGEVSVGSSAMVEVLGTCSISGVGTVVVVGVTIEGGQYYVGYIKGYNGIEYPPSLLLGVASLSGSGAVTAAAILDVLGASSVSADSQLDIVALLEIPASAVVDLSGSLSASSLVEVLGSSHVQVDSDVNADAVLLILAAADLDGTVEIVAIPKQYIEMVIKRYYSYRDLI